MGQTSWELRWDGGLLGEEQSTLAQEWLVRPRLIRDLSWGLVGTKILHVQAPAGRVIIKAGAPAPTASRSRMNTTRCSRPTPSTCP